MAFSNCLAIAWPPWVARAGECAARRFDFTKPAWVQLGCSLLNQVQPCPGQEPGKGGKGCQEVKKSRKQSQHAAVLAFWCLAVIDFFWAKGRMLLLALCPQYKAACVLLWSHLFEVHAGGTPAADLTNKRRDSKLVRVVTTCICKTWYL